MIKIIQQMAQMWEQLGRSRKRLISALCLPLFFFALIPRSFPSLSHSLSSLSISLYNIILYLSSGLLQQPIVQNSYRISKRFQLNCWKVRWQHFLLGRCATLFNCSQKNYSFAILSTFEVKSTGNHPMNVHAD